MSQPSTHGVSAVDSRADFRFAVNVTPKPGILDPQGRAIEGSLGHLAIDGVSAIRVGRRIELTVTASDEAAARATVDELARELLANLLIEAYTIERIAGASSMVSSEVEAEGTGARA